MSCITIKKACLFIISILCLSHSSINAMQPPSQKPGHKPQKRPEFSVTLPTVDQQLIEAAADGNLQAVNDALTANANLEAMDKSRRTALYWAARGGHTQLVERLLHAGANVNAEAVTGTPLYVAAQQGHITVVRQLLEAGADVNIANHKKWSPLHIAAVMGHEEIVEELLTTNADINAPDNVESTPLHLAAEHGRHIVIQQLLEAGADVHAVDLFDRTALFEAALNGHLRVVQLLLEAGADADMATNIRTTALCMAAFRDHHVVVRELIMAGADVTTADNEGFTPLYHAADNGNNVLAFELIESGSHVTAVTNDGLTPLHAAANYGNIVTVELLLAAGAVVNAADNEGRVPLHGAAENGHEAVVRELIEAGADVNAATNEGWTPLYGAAQNGRITVLNILLAHPEIRVNRTNRQGHTAVFEALENEHVNDEHVNAGQLLLRYGAIGATLRQIRTALGAGTLAYFAATGQIDNLINLLDRQPLSNEIHEALPYATGQGQIEAVSQLLAAGAERHEALQLVTTILGRRSDTSAITIHHQAIARLFLRDQIISQIRRPQLIPTTTRNSALARELRGRIMTPNRRLLYAAQTGNEQELRQALRDGADVHHRDPQGYTAAWRVTLHHDEPTTQTLVALLMFHGFDPNTPDPRVLNLITWAVQHQWFNFARLLLRYGTHASENDIRAIPLTDLANAAAIGNIREVQELLATLPPREEVEDALAYASGQGHIDVVRSLVLVLGTPSTLARLIVSYILRRSTLTPEERSTYQQILQLVGQEPAHVELQATLPQSLAANTETLRHVKGEPPEGPSSSN